MGFSRQDPAREVPRPEALGQSEAFIEFQEKISKVAPIDRPVLILGERGTGKELAASRLHFLSKRWQRPFVTLNCSALSPNLIESELFGYEKGAFTGAGSRHTGRFETASGGTLFLDEIGTIPMEVQEKILRVVEYGSFERVGASRSIHVDVRIVAATNADLAQMAVSGEFKQDLLDRLSFEVIYVPPLRYRKEDIPILAHHFAGRMAFELGRDEIPKLSSKARKALDAYPWPGNIRELKNVIERAVYTALTDEIIDISFDPFTSPYADTLKKKPRPGTPPGTSATPIQADPVPGETELWAKSLLEKPFKTAVQEFEWCLVSRALADCQFNQKKAAALLGLSYDQFRGLRKKFASRL